MDNINQEKTMKKTFWGAFAFYFLIAFEFAYMASPFAAYFYSIYRPALTFFNNSPTLAWLISFFMPHGVRETKSVIINLHEIIGFTLAALGFLSFCFGACQVYYNKLTKKGAVTGGIYNFIRHPQYISFIICSFGLLLAWPRYIVLIMFITMIFVYYFLALAEERECEARFGSSYVNYKNRTNMFIPFSIPVINKLPSLPKSKPRKILAITAIYILSLATGIGIAKAVNTHSLNNLYATYTDNSANISISSIESSKLKKILDIALNDEEVKTRIDTSSKDENAKYLNYILPSEWFVAEVPMNGVEHKQGHKSPSDYDKNTYKIIFTQAKIRSDKAVIGKDIITNVSERIPLIEVWVNVEENKVIKVEEITKDIMYKNTPVAIY